MGKSSGHRAERARLLARISSSAEDHLPRCTVLGCGRPTMRAARVGLGTELCRYHNERRARHGSPFAPPIKATDLRPYVKVALAWIREQRKCDPAVADALRRLDGLLWGSGGGGVAPRAGDIKGRSPKYRARVAFMRLHAAKVPPARLLAVHLGMAACIEDDREAHRVPEFRIVQTAKALHRLASGTHWRWEMPLPNGNTAPAQLHVYPRSSGQVLRFMGKSWMRFVGRLPSVTGTPSGSSSGRNMARTLRTCRAGSRPGNAGCSRRGNTEGSRSRV